MRVWPDYRTQNSVGDYGGLRPFLARLLHNHPTRNGVEVVSLMTLPVFTGRPRRTPDLPSMSNDPETDLLTQEEVHAATYRLAYAYAIDQLRDGLHPDAVRLGLCLVRGYAPGSIRRVTGAEWRGLEDALTGRPPSPHSVGLFWSEDRPCVPLW